MSNEIQILDELRAILVDPEMGDRAKVLTALIRLNVDKETRKLENVDVERLVQALDANHRQRVSAALKEAVEAGHLIIKRTPNRPASYRMPMTAERMERITNELLPLANLKRSVAPATELAVLNTGQQEKRTAGNPDSRKSGRPVSGNQDSGRPDFRTSSYIQDFIQDYQQDYFAVALDPSSVTETRDTQKRSKSHAPTTDGQSAEDAPADRPRGGARDERTFVKKIFNGNTGTVLAVVMGAKACTEFEAAAVVAGVMRRFGPAVTLEAWVEQVGPWCRRKDPPKDPVAALWKEASNRKLARDAAAKKKAEAGPPIDWTRADEATSNMIYED